MMVIRNKTPKQMVIMRPMAIMTRKEMPPVKLPSNLSAISSEALNLGTQMGILTGILMPMVINLAK